MQKVLPRSLSDHNVVSLSVGEKNQGPKPFKFFNYWTEESGFKELIHSTQKKLQTDADVSQTIWDKLRLLKFAIKDWYQQVGIGDPFRISQLEEDIEQTEKGLLVNQPDATTRDVLLKRKTSLWSFYRVEERS